MNKDIARKKRRLGAMHSIGPACQTLVGRQKELQILEAKLIGDLLFMPGAGISGQPKPPTLRYCLSQRESLGAAQGFAILSPIN